MIDVIGGGLYQWDTGRIAAVKPETDDIIHEVHFTTKDMDYAYVVSTYENDGAILCAIPNVLLQQERSIIAYEVTKTDTGEMSVATTKLPLNKRNKPQDYAFTEDELKNFERLEALIPTKLSQLEKDVDLGVTDYDALENTPICNVSSDENNMVAICELPSGAYRFSGTFTPYSGSNIYYNFRRNQLVNIITASAGTHVQAFYPDDNTVQFCAIMRDESSEKGWTVEEKDVCLNELYDNSKVVPDWNQSDETAPDYIKNRPFYEEEEFITFIDKQEITFTASGYNLGKLIQIGKNYIIDIDGIQYKCTSYEKEVIAGEIYIPCINSTGDLFYIDGWYMYVSDNGTHTIAIYESNPIVTTIPKKFLPKAVPISDATDTVTKEKFNALLSALRYAGYIAYSE